MRRLDGFVDRGEYLLLVAPGNSVGQSFVSGHNGLAGIKLLVRNPRLGMDQEYELRLVDESGQVVRSLRVKESNLGWDDWFRFDFPAIGDSAGKTYRLEVAHTGVDKNPEDVAEYNRVMTGEEPRSVRSDGSGFERQGVINQSYLNLLYTRDDAYSGGQAYVADVAVAGDIQFQSYYQVSPVGFVRDSALGAAKRLMGDGWFVLIYGALLAAVAALMIRRFKTILAGGV